MNIDLNPGNHNIGETPVPIPNTEVKPFSADGTARGAEWESRSLPGFFISGRRVGDGVSKDIFSFLIHRLQIGDRDELPLDNEA